MRKTIRTIALIVFTLTMASLVGEAALAGGKAGGSSLNVVVVSSPSGDGNVHYGSMITFDVHSTSARPYVAVACSQNGSIVYSASAGFYSDYTWTSDQYMTLKSNSWTGGAANCTANLWYWKGAQQRTLATTSFHADA